MVVVLSWVSRRSVLELGLVCEMVVGRFGGGAWKWSWVSPRVVFEVIGSWWFVLVCFLDVFGSWLPFEILA